MLHTERQLPRNILFGVLRADCGKQSLERCDVARWRGRQDAIVECHQVSGQCAATRVACAAEPSRIDLGSFRQIVEAANAIPNMVAGGLPTDQKGTDSGERMLGCTSRNEWLAV